jgi:hypothetical protein
MEKKASEKLPGCVVSTDIWQSTFCARRTPRLRKSKGRKTRPVAMKNRKSPAPRIGRVPCVTSLKGIFQRSTSTLETRGSASGRELPERTRYSGQAL